MVLDKTGTITEGKPEVTGIILTDENNWDEEALLRLAYALEYKSEHPLAKAIVRRAECVGAAETVSDFKVYPGNGVSGIYNGVNVYAGSSAFIRQVACDISECEA